MDPHRNSADRKQNDQTVVPILGEEEANTKESRNINSNNKPRIQIPVPEIALLSNPSPNKPPRPPRPGGITPRPGPLTPSYRTLSRRTSISKPKSRFEEPFHDSSGPLSNRSSGTPRLPTDDIDEEEEEEEEEEIYKKELLTDNPVRRKKYRFRDLIEWSILVLSIAFCIASVNVHRLKGHVIWGLEIWRWCLMVAVVCCGRLVSHWFIAIIVFFIERNFLLKKKVLYFVYGLKKSVEVFLWWLLILVSWLFVFEREDQRSEKTKNVLCFITRLLISLLVGSVLWLAKTLLVKISASSFHMNRFFDRIQESIFHQYLLQMLSGPPVLEMAERVGTVTNSGMLSFRSKMKRKGKKKEEKIDVWKLYKLRQEKVSAWTMKGLVNVISTSGLSTLSNAIDESYNQKQREITNEWEAKSAAFRIFKNVAKPGNKYIEGEDLLRFLTREEVDYVLPLFEGAADTGHIRKSALMNWVVKCYLDRKSLAHSLNDTNTAVKQLHRIATCIVIVIALVTTLILTGIATTKVLVFISSQLLLVAFMFGNSCKTVFEALIFVFVMHPYDVGDRCVVDGNMMVVEEMNILTTVFLKFDLEKLYYPNSVLATKAISNLYRSPDMWDTLPFSVSMSTSMEKIGALKAKIKTHLETHSNHWHPNHSVVVLGIENMNKMNMALYAYHTMNFQAIIEKNNRRTELMYALKNIFEELSIQYTLLPQEVGFRYSGSAPLPMAISQKGELV